jgi:hypothetical protein
LSKPRSVTLKSSSIPTTARLMAGDLSAFNFVKALR